MTNPTSNLVSFDSLPLGARFKYPGQDGVFVKLENGGTGIVAEWDSPALNWPGQGIYSFADSEQERASGKVEWLDSYAPETKTHSYCDCPVGTCQGGPINRCVYRLFNVDATDFIRERSQVETVPEPAVVDVVKYAKDHGTSTVEARSALKAPGDHRKCLICGKRWRDHSESERAACEAAL